MKKIDIKVILTILVIFLGSILNAQTNPFSVKLEPITISDLGGLQAYAFGQYDGKWLIVGGRLDGLHRRQPFAAFDLAGHNNQLIVVDPVSLKKWSAPLTSLPASVQAQLSSTNMQFHQEGDYLYCLGGYGYSPALADHTTYGNLTAINVPAVINAVVSNTGFTSFFRQISDAQFQVTGGVLEKIDNTYYLVGGQKFLGRYNPMGPNHGPGFVQEYTNAIRKFNLSDDGTTVSINHLTGFTDTVNLHRRDYNVLPQILPNQAQGLTAFSGVFQYQADVPFLNSVNIDDAGYGVNPGFNQYYNHYHCATIPMYSVDSNAMHNVFFGGIAQYYDSLGVLVKDDNVPFVKTIARVSRDANGQMAEYKLPVEMPALLGAGAEFIPIEALSMYENGVIKLDSLKEDQTLIGYIYGGISSTDKNIFFTNTGTQSSASSQIYKVYLVQGDFVGLHELNEQSVGSLNVKAYPNPNDGSFVVEYSILETADVKISLTDASGKLIEEKKIEQQTSGQHTFFMERKSALKTGAYFLTIETPYELSTQKVLIQ